MSLLVLYNLMNGWGGVPSNALWASRSRTNFSVRTKRCLKETEPSLILKALILPSPLNHCFSVSYPAILELTIAWSRLLGHSRWRARIEGLASPGRMFHRCLSGSHHTLLDSELLLQLGMASWTLKIVGGLGSPSGVFEREQTFWLLFQKERLDVVKTTLSVGFVDNVSCKK